MWNESYKRTSIEEISGLLDNSRLVLARHGGKIVGSVVVEEDKKAKVGGFGMLVVDPKMRGLRIGSALIEACENWAKLKGYRTMKLGLLTPKTWKQPEKEKLHSWYTRIGYVKQKKFTTLHKDWPHLAVDLACECVLTDYLKPI